MSDDPRTGLTVTHRRYVPYSHAHYGGDLVDGAYVLGLFGDVATEVCIRTDGDEGLFAGYDDVAFVGPVRAGDVVEVTATVTRVGRRSRGRRLRGARDLPGRPGAFGVRRRRPRPAAGLHDRDRHRRRPLTNLGVYSHGVDRLRSPLGRVLAGAVSGLLLMLTFAPYDLWALAPLGVAVLTLATRGAPLRVSALVGHGLGPVLLRSALPLERGVRRRGPVAVPRGLPGAVRRPAGALGLTLVQRLPGWPFWVGCVWVADEAVRGRWPFEGRHVGTGRVRPGRRTHARARRARWRTAHDLRGRRCRWPPRSGRRGRSSRPREVWPAPPSPAPPPSSPSAPSCRRRRPSGPEVTVALIQGNVPRLGLDFNSQREAVLKNHVAGTEALAAEVAAGTQPQPDLVIWPENASDVDPYRDAGAARPDPGRRRQHRRTRPWSERSSRTPPTRTPCSTSGSSGSRRPRPRRAGRGSATSSSTRCPSPSTSRSAPSPAGSPRRSTGSAATSPRDQPGVLQVGPARVGDVICFEVAYDGLVRSTVVSGAQLLTVQTNNATFGRTPETEQQLAMSRLRAVEHGRWVLVAATSGVSATIAPDGLGGAAGRDLHGRPDRAARTPVGRPHAGRPRRCPARGGPRAPRFRGRCLVGYRHVAPSPTADRRTHSLYRRGRAAVTDSLASQVPTVLVCIPTYDEAANLQRIVSRVRAAVPDAARPRHRRQQPGRHRRARRPAGGRRRPRPRAAPRRQGGPGRRLPRRASAGPSTAGYDVIVEMDADGSHRPEELPTLLAAVDAGADLVLGSRWVEGGQVVNWPRSREVISRGAATPTPGSRSASPCATRPAATAPSGPRPSRASTSTASSPRATASRSTWPAGPWSAASRSTEVPITFVEREAGVSKMSRGIVGEALLARDRLGREDPLGPGQDRGSEGAGPGRLSACRPSCSSSSSSSRRSRSPRSCS